MVELEKLHRHCLEILILRFMMIEDAQNFYGIYYEGGKMDNRFSPKNTTVIICCAGMGTRLGIGTTKALIDIEGKPLIIRLLEQLNQCKNNVFK